MGGLAALAVVGGVVILNKSSPPVPVTTTAVTSTQSTSSGQQLFISLSSNQITLDGDVVISVTETNGYAGSVVDIKGLPFALSITLNSSAIGSTTVSVSKAGTYTLYATEGKLTSNKTTLKVLAQCTNNAQCPSGEICSGGKCVPCPQQNCPCGSIWKQSQCSCVTQTPQTLVFTDEAGASETSFDYPVYYNLVYHGLTEALISEVFKPVCLHITNSMSNCSTTYTGICGTSSSPYGAIYPAVGMIYGELKDNQGNPICNQTVQLSLSNNTGQKATSNDSAAFRFTSSVHFASGVDSITAKTDSNGKFKTKLYFYTTLTGWQGSFGGTNFPASVESITMASLVQINASYGNITTQALLNNKGTVRFCGYA